MTPAGYHVVASTGSPMLILRQADAVERAVQRRGTCTPLFSLSQVIEFLEDSDADTGDAIDLLSEVPT